MTDLQAKKLFFERERLKFVRSREIMAATMEEPGTRQAYRANVACILMDTLGVQNSETRNHIADVILDRVFRGR